MQVVSQLARDQLWMVLSNLWAFSLVCLAYAGGLSASEGWALDGPKQFVSFLLVCLAYKGGLSASEVWALDGPKQFVSFLACMLGLSRWSVARDELWMVLSNLLAFALVCLAYLGSLSASEGWALDGPKQFGGFLFCMHGLSRGQSASEGWALVYLAWFVGFLACLLGLSRWSVS